MTLPNNFFKLFLALFFAGFVYACVMTFRLKTVELDGDDLIVSNFGEQARIPLSAVAAVKGGRGGKNPIKLEFRIATDFGEAIRFQPPQQRSVLWPWQQHPLVAELKSLCKLDTHPL
jgi:hypothetical protein